MSASHTEADPPPNRSYGLAAAAVGLMLVWYAAWTIAVNALVLAGSYYRPIPWCLLLATLVTVAAGWCCFRPIARRYARLSLSPPVDFAGRDIARERMAIAVALVTGAAVAIGVQLSASITVLTAGAAAAAVVAARAARILQPQRSLPGARDFAREVAVLVLLLAALYYLGHRPDTDDANYINLASGAQSTAGHVFALDTMLGDGPGPIHLPTYKVHSFELLGAALSTLTGLTPIVVLHLVLPAPQLLFIALVFALVLVPVANRHWLCAALIAIGFLYANTDTLGTWGLHGLIRLFQGKGLIVTALVPLVAGLTVRWFNRREKSDLVALSLCHICAIGLSANGLYITPIASGLVAATMLVSGGRTAWRALPWLAPTLIYPAAIAAIIQLQHLALPSEVVEVTQPYGELRFVVGWRSVGLITLALLPLLPLAAGDRRYRLATAIYFPLALLMVLNPLGWRVASTITGNLGFRVLWALPGALMIGAIGAAILRSFVRDARWTGAAGAAVLAAGIGYNALAAEPSLRVAWHAPGLKVDRLDEQAAERVAALAPAGCNVLVPERVAVWLAGMPGAPHPAFVRALYLKHYRFTMNRRELALRWRLFDVTAGVPAPMPRADELARYHVRLGLIATDPGSPGLDPSAALARSLRLDGPRRSPEGLLYWRGGCQPVAGDVEH